MISPEKLIKELTNQGIDFFTGVPDSLLSDCTKYIENSKKNVITANEGSAIAMAAGYHLSTKKIACAYMQNSGLGNAINPLISLTSKEVYSIPVLLMIGWRGQPGTIDEPQHQLQGSITESLLKICNLNFITIKKKDEEKTILEKVKYILNIIKKESIPGAILVEKNSIIFEENKSKLNLKEEKNIFENLELTREDAIKEIIETVNNESAIFCTTGKASRELLEIRDATKNDKSKDSKDFYTVGSMGHVLSIASGCKVGNIKKNIICIDGDGSTLMHMGSMAINANLKEFNILHIILNNGCHESVGGQKTVGFDIDFLKIAEGCGYKSYALAETKNSDYTAAKDEKVTMFSIAMAF